MGYAYHPRTRLACPHGFVVGPIHAYSRAHFERKASLAIMGSMILSKHLERTWPSIHLLTEPISKSGSGMH